MIITLSDLLAGIRARKTTLGIIDTPERAKQMRNTGLRRTVSAKFRAPVRLSDAV